MDEGLLGGGPAPGEGGDAPGGEGDGWADDLDDIDEVAQKLDDKLDDS